METARLMASALGGGLDSAEAGAAGVAAALPPQYVEFKEQVRQAPCSPACCSLLHKAFSAPGRATSCKLHRRLPAALLPPLLGRSPHRCAAALSLAARLPTSLQIRLEMLGIKQRMAELRGMHGRATLSRFDDANDDEVQVRFGWLARVALLGVCGSVMPPAHCAYCV